MTICLEQRPAAHVTGMRPMDCPGCGRRVTAPTERNQFGQWWFSLATDCRGCGCEWERILEASRPFPPGFMGAR